MNIDDILKQPEYQNLDQFLFDEMCKTAGNKILYLMGAVFVSEIDTREWYFSNLDILNGKRPYDYCVLGREDELEILLNRMNSNIYKSM